MNSQQRRKYIRLLGRKKNHTAKELLCYHNLFCKRYPDPWMNEPFTEEELKCFTYNEQTLVDF